MRIIVFSSLFTILLFHPFEGKAQVEIPGTEHILDKMRLNKAIKGEQFVAYSNITGNPYVFENFQKGTLVLLTQDSVQSDIRYDIYADEIQLRDKNGLYGLIHPEKVKRIQVDNEIIIFSPYINSPEEQTSKDSSYFFVKTSGRCALLVKKNMRIQDAEPPKLYQDAKPAKFVPTKDTYYLKSEDKQAVEIRNEKVLLSVLEDRKADIQSYIKQNKLKTNNINDLAQIVAFYNGL